MLHVRTLFTESRDAFFDSRSSVASRWPITAKCRGVMPACRGESGSASALWSPRALPSHVLPCAGGFSALSSGGRVARLRFHAHEMRGPGREETAQAVLISIHRGSKNVELGIVHARRQAATLRSGWDNAASLSRHSQQQSAKLWRPASGYVRPCRVRPTTADLLCAPVRRVSFYVTCRHGGWDYFRCATLFCNLCG